jgi:hypothetical protein
MTPFRATSDGNLMRQGILPIPESRAGCQDSRAGSKTHKAHRVPAATIGDESSTQFGGLGRAT